jgi:beta-N-acetylhexosaminidase
MAIAVMNDCKKWVDEKFAQMSGREKVGQLLHPTLTYWDRRIPQEKLLNQIMECQAGGAFMAGRPYRELRGFVQQVQQGARIPVIFSGDCECGAATAKEGKVFGAAMALAAVEDLQEASEIAYQVGRVTAEQSVATGIRWSFAPVVDINGNPDNPITNVRCYGDDVERIIACSTSYLKGMEEGGIAATLKHFPGDGFDGRDQHVCTTINSLDFSEWDETFGRVFREGIKAGASSIMMGHIGLACRSTRSPRGGYLPATLDPAIQEDLLRGHLGFEGVVISDAIGMGGMAGHVHAEADRVVENLKTGSDMVLFPMEAVEAMDAVLKALDEGHLEEKKIDASVRRVMTMKYRKLVAIDTPLLPSDEEAVRAFESCEIRTQLANRLASHSVTLLKDQEALLPMSLEVGKRVLVFDLPEDKSDLATLAVVDGGASGSQEKSAMQEELESLGYEVDWVQHLAEYEKKKESCDLLIYLFRTRPQAGRNSVRVCYNALQSMDFPMIYSDFPCVFISLASPYVLWDIPQLPNLICTYSGGGEAQRVAVQALFGKISFLGKCPVKIPEYLNIQVQGEGNKRK